MTESGARSAPDAAHGVLGLPRSAAPDDLLLAYLRLRAHIETRAAARRDPLFAAERAAELAALHAALLAAPGIDPARVPPLAGRTGTFASLPPQLLVAWAAVASAAAVGLAALLLVGRLASSGGAAAAEPGGIVVVAADPADAELRITTGEDERVVVSAAADGTPHALAPGDYALRVSHADCPEAWQVELQLGLDDEVRYQPELCLGRGSLVVRSNVAEARVRIDGVDVGASGGAPHGLRVGGHDVEVAKTDYAPWSARVKIAPDEELALNAELAPATAAATAAAAPVAMAAPAASAAAAAPAMPAPPAPPANAPSAPDVAAAAGPPNAAGGYVAQSGTGRPLPPRTGIGGSKTWHDAIKQDLISQYDRNGSRSLDTLAEIDSIDCETWKNIEQSYETGGLAVEMTYLYGFDGSEAPVNTLGVAPSVRDYTYERMKSCGLKARR